MLIQLDVWMFRMEVLTLMPSMRKPRVAVELSVSLHCMYLGLRTPCWARSCSVGAPGSTATIFSYMSFRKRGRSLAFVSSSSKYVLKCKVLIYNFLQLSFIFAYFNISFYCPVHFMSLLLFYCFSLTYNLQIQPGLVGEQHYVYRSSFSRLNASPKGTRFPTQLHFLHPVLSLTCCPSCSPWWKASRSQPAGHPSDYSPALLSVRHHNNQAHRGAECPSSASVGTVAHTHSIASTSVRTPRPGSYLEWGTHRKKIKD